MLAHGVADLNHLLQVGLSMGVQAHGHLPEVLEVEGVLKRPEHSIALAVAAAAAVGHVVGGGALSVALVAGLVAPAPADVHLLQGHVVQHARLYAELMASEVGGHARYHQLCLLHGSRQPLVPGVGHALISLGHGIDEVWIPALLGIQGIGTGDGSELMLGEVPHCQIGNATLQRLQQNLNRSVTGSQKGSGMHAQKG